MKNLKQLYQEHHGKSSDKWDIYLSTYHDILASRQTTLSNLLEIGVQNGGSLEIWQKYFPEAKNIVGCDINPNCSNLEYESNKIKIVIGDSSTEAVKKQLAEISESYDVIIDDGSHKSSDIIKSFLLYFPLVENNGIYIIEDLHCSYWENFEGGLYDPYSSMAFLKKLADIPNLEHWGIPRTASEFLSPFYQHYQCQSFDQVDYSLIHSVTFINSLCIIQKKAIKDNILGSRNVVGEDELVVVGNKLVAGTVIQVSDQQGNRWSQQTIFPEMEWEKLVINESKLAQESNSLKKTIEQHVDDLAKKNRDLVYYKSIEDVLRKEVEHIKDDSENKSHLIERLSHDNHALLTSTSWRITQPLRNASTQARRIKRASYIASKVIETHGVKESMSRALAIYRRNGLSGMIAKLRHINQLHTSTQTILSAKKLPAISIMAQRILMPKVLIIAEMSIPQCKKYRVEQKVELFKKLHIPASSIDWTDLQGCMTALQHHSIVIFYRVPAYESVLRIFDECERLNLLTYWEVDDLIFDEEILRQSKTLHELDKDTFNGLLDGARLYHQSLIRCKNAIASTAPLALSMENAGAQSSIVVENALDPETIITAQSIPENRKSEQDGIIRIVYGSGTSTHNVDFREASDAILNILKRNKKVHFRLAGVLELPASFESVKEQIERIPFCPYTDYLKVLAECDISIAPLENFIFNDSKSNIKYIEASIVGLPSICSPRSNFTAIIDHGVNGFLCETPEEWEETFNNLIDNSALRKTVGLHAKDNVLVHYSPESIAEQQVSNITKDFERHIRSTKKHVLSVNCFYSPRSFGGATVVAEALNKCFVDNEKIEVHVLTSLSEDYGPINTLQRYEAFDQDCYGIVLPNFLPESQQIVNKNIEAAFIQALELVKPDLVHFHSIQGLGITMLEICAERHIPIVVTTHDYWWLYDHQFILSFDNKHKLRGVFNGHDSELITNDELNYYQMKKRKMLSLATRIISPSEFTTKLYQNEGYKNAILNKNGVTFPEREINRFASRPLRFGYVGGNTDIKGYHLIKRVFNKVSPNEGCVVIVDNTLNLGYRSFSDHDLKELNSVEVVPAFTQDNMDDFYNSIDVLLYPTQSKESFGLTVREALIRNVWVITSDAGGAAEDIIEGENGIVIPFNNDADALHAAVQETIKHFAKLPPDLAIQLPHSHIRSFTEQYEELEKIYLETLN